MHPRPDYKRMSHDTLRQFFESHPIPNDPDLLDHLLKEALTLIPRITRNPKHKLPPEIRAARSHLRHLIKRRWGSDQYRIVRQQYRESLTNFINNDIEEQLDSSHDPGFFRFTKKSTINRPVPSLHLIGQTYSGHARIAKCFADHHRTGPRIPVTPLSSPGIPRVLPREVSDGLARAPASSATGPDQISASLLGILHRVHPTCLGCVE